MTVDEAISDLLSISTDIRRLAVFDADGVLLGAGPATVSTDAGAAADGLWQAAVEAAAAEPGDEAAAPLEHVAVKVGDAAVVALEARGRRIVALTAAEPPLGLVLFDLRTCLADAFPAEGDV